VVIVAVLPFQLPLLQHLLTGSIATGFLQYDAPYYMANARAVFERGTGLVYPNAYDPDPNAPAIYFHWLTWLLGAAVKILHIDPGVVFASVGVIAAIVCSALTLRLVELVLPDRHGRLGWFLLTMWGGGVICLGTAGLNLLQGRPLLDSLFRLDAGVGWWSANWGRNLLLPTEAVYHCFVAAAWIGVLQCRWALAFASVAALAATHPFSGVQHALILGAWVGGLALYERTPAAWGRVVIACVILGAIGLYYFWFLNLFPAHRRLVAVWSSAHRITLVNVFLAVGPFALVALWRFRREQWRAGQTEWFWFTAIVVTFLLMKHDWFIAPRQPAHFSRGYLWLPIWMLALPQLQRWTQRFVAGRRRSVAFATVALFGVVAASDNTTFIVNELKIGESDRIHLNPEQREMFRWMDHAELRGTLLTSDTRLSYYAAVYAGVRPYYGHLFNTPDIHTRWRDVAAWHRRGEKGPWLQTIDYVLVQQSDPPLGFDREQWHELHRNHDYVLLSRPAQTGPSR
jgi:hypothetical protein